MSNHAMPVHRILDIAYRREWIECACGTEITAEPDGFFPDRHGPLIVAWDSHRRKNGVGRVGMFRDGHGVWRRNPAA